MIALLYLGLIVLAFFFLIVVPQRRQLAAHRALVASLEVGDEIVTSGGIHGTLRSVDGATVEVEIADKVVVTLARNAVAQRTTAPAEAGAAEIDERAPGSG